MARARAATKAQTIMYFHIGSIGRNCSSRVSLNCDTFSRAISAGSIL